MKRRPFLPELCSCLTEPQSVAAHRPSQSASLCCSYFWFHLHAADGTGAGLDRVHSATTRRGKHREDHADGGSHRQHHHQGQDGAGHREGRLPVSSTVHAATATGGGPLARSKSRRSAIQSSARRGRDYELEVGAIRRCGAGPKLSAVSLDDASAN